MMTPVTLYRSVFYRVRKGLKTLLLSPKVAGELAKDLSSSSIRRIQARKWSDYLEEKQIVDEAVRTATEKGLERFGYEVTAVPIYDVEEEYFQRKKQWKLKGKVKKMLEIWKQRFCQKKLRLLQTTLPIFLRHWHGQGEALLKQLSTP